MIFVECNELRLTEATMMAILQEHINSRSRSDEQVAVITFSYDDGEGYYVAEVEPQA